MDLISDDSAQAYAIAFVFIALIVVGLSWVVMAEPFQQIHDEMDGIHEQIDTPQGAQDSMSTLYDSYQYVMLALLFALLTFVIVYSLRVQDNGR
jgi:ABC-type branched-subunit amino acid transport system permease subunit